MLSGQVACYTFRMLTLLTSLGLLVLFYLLGLSADLIIKHIRVIGDRLGIPVFFLGLLLGLLTSMPETGVGLNAIAQGIPAISVGNLFGGTIVLFCLVLGFSIVLNREIVTDGKSSTLWPALAYLTLPLLFGLRGYIDAWTGLGFLILYPGVLLYLYLAHGKEQIRKAHDGRARLAKEIAYIVIGLVAVIILSNVIVRMTVPLLVALRLPAFLVGLFVYAIGTNLPELIVAIRSWKRHVKELSLGNILGSACTNVFLLGAFALARELPVTVDGSYAVLLFISLLTFGLVLWFYRSGKRFTRTEGLLLIAVYLLFVVIQLPFFTAFALER